MTNHQFDTALGDAICRALTDLYFEVENEYDPETIKARIKAKIKEVSSTS